MPRYSHHYIRTRVAILAARLIPPEQWPQWIAADIEELLQQLKLSPTDAADTVEKVLVSRALIDFQRLFRPFSGSDRTLLNHLLHRYELFNLKVLIRGKFATLPEQEIRAQLIDLAPFATLPLERLLQTDDPYEMLRMLEQTSYAPLVRPARAIFEDQGHKLFVLDAAIDRHFLSTLRRHIHNLPRSDQHPLLDLYGTLMDRLNLLWLIRYRFNYDLSPARTYALLSATGKRLQTARLMQLARAESLEGVLDALPHPLQQLLGESREVNPIELRMEQQVVDLARDMIDRTHSMISRVFCYVLLRESELQRLQAILKGKLLGLEPRLITLATGWGAS